MLASVPFRFLSTGSIRLAAAVPACARIRQACQDRTARSAAPTTMRSMRSRFSQSAGVSGGYGRSLGPQIRLAMEPMNRMLLGLSFQQRGEQRQGFVGNLDRAVRDLFQGLLSGGVLPEVHSKVLTRLTISGASVMIRFRI